MFIIRKAKRKKQHRSDSIIQTGKYCYKTGVTNNLVCHHVMNGVGLRPKADKYGLWVWLEDGVHKWLHDTSDGAKYQRGLKRIAQQKFEEIYSHDLWMREFHKNYL